MYYLRGIAIYYWCLALFTGLIPYSMFNYLSDKYNFSDNKTCIILSLLGILSYFGLICLIVIQISTIIYYCNKH